MTSADVIAAANRFAYLEFDRGQERQEAFACRVHLLGAAGSMANSTRSASRGGRQLAWGEFAFSGADAKSFNRLVVALSATRVASE